LLGGGGLDGCWKVCLIAVVYALAILTLIGVNLQFHFLAELPADEPADAVRIPASGLYQLIERGTGLPARLGLGGAPCASLARTGGPLWAASLLASALFSGIGYLGHFRISSFGMIVAVADIHRSTSQHKQGKSFDFLISFSLPFPLLLIHPPATLTIGDARVSTDRQADKGVSLEAQKSRIEAMAVVQERTLLEVIVDGGESAKNLNRPGLQRLLSLVQAGKVRAVIVAKLDRLTRSVKDLCSLLELFEKKNVALISVAESLDTSTAAGRLVITIMGAVSQWEREAIGERTREALRHKRTKGERVGNIEFGYRLGADGRHLESEAIEQAALAAIWKLRAQGHSLRRIAATLNGQGHRTRCGSAWRLESVNRVIQRTSANS
jgi:DNA invertase Pin-like site-specific DNA recombinase